MTRRIRLPGRRIAAELFDFGDCVPFPSPPTPFLEVRVHRLESLPGITAVCAGYEGQRWREKQLASHLIRWLPEFALKHSEVEALGSHNAVELIAKAAKSIYASPKFESRGEFGELLLHVVLRQCFRTVPAISKYFYKDSRNDTVKGFDAVHVVADESSLELWLGEVKFYDEIMRAIRDVMIEIERHLERDYLRDEFAAITNKIDDEWPHASRLKKLLHPDTSLDAVFDCVCVPVLLTYDSPVVQRFDALCESYVAQFEEEVLRHHVAFQDKLRKLKLPEKLKLHLFLMPLHQKASLIQAMDDALKRVQAIQ